ncbi:MAG: site-2 protease family protein [Treponema sp.]|nr:site-2 protease family protein [Treponema sp.]
MVGEMAAGGFSQSFGTGLRSMAGILAFISIALCIMNLLPLPIIDGGLIILFIVEIIRRKPAHPKAVKIFQTAGVIIICLLMIFAFYSDIMSFMRQGSEEKLIDKIGMSVETGLVISQIAPNTYAAGTELVQNDTILKINNETVSSTADIENVINNMAKNLSTVMHIEYIRDGMENSTELTLPLNIFL